VVSLPFCLLSGLTEPLAPFTNLHQSLHDRLWLSSPPFLLGTSTPWRHRGCFAAGHHRAVPRPSHRRQSNPSESNRPPRLLVCVPWTTSPLASAPTAVGVRWGRTRAHL
jgi:hypothetical protein